MLIQRLPFKSNPIPIHHFIYEKGVRFNGVRINPLMFEQFVRSLFEPRGTPLTPASRKNLDKFLAQSVLEY